MGYYDYKELREKALKTGEREDLFSLGEWLENYGATCWNGEKYDIDDGLFLRPVSKPIEFDDNGEVIQWETVDYVLE